ncbi:MAG: cation diffusion facilitator family transporter [Eubacteriales bacterium]|nr:cation diffusion facilitator family transporter [Eubacteriales bacterium]
MFSKLNKKAGSNEEAVAYRVSAVSIFVNLTLSVFKLLAGLLAASGAMISDAVHSASDVFSTFVVIIGVKISNKKSDEDHEYGHERLECIAAIILSIILLLTGIGIGISGLEKILAGNYEELQIPGILALVAAILSIVIKEWMFWYTKAAAEKINSGALLADAWHHRSDSLSSIGAFVGILGARLGFPILDPIASVVICLFIGKAAYDIFKDAVDKLVDKSCDEETEKAMEKCVMSQEGVARLDSLQTRLFGAKIYVDIEIAADGNKTLYETHTIAEQVHDSIEKEFPMVKHCMVHVNPI